jgi:hypothetical protein
MSNLHSRCVAVFALGLALCAFLSAVSEETSAQGSTAGGKAKAEGKAKTERKAKAPMAAKPSVQKKQHPT